MQTHVGKPAWNSEGKASRSGLFRDMTPTKMATTEKAYNTQIKKPLQRLPQKFQKGTAQLRSKSPTKMRASRHNQQLQSMIKQLRYMKDQIKGEPYSTKVELLRKLRSSHQSAVNAILQFIKSAQNATKATNTSFRSEVSELVRQLAIYCAELENEMSTNENKENTTFFSHLPANHSTAPFTHTKPVGFSSSSFAKSLPLHSTAPTSNQAAQQQHLSSSLSASYSLPAQQERVGPWDWRLQLDMPYMPPPPTLSTNHPNSHSHTQVRFPHSTYPSHSSSSSSSTLRAPWSDADINYVLGDDLLNELIDDAVLYVSKLTQLGERSVRSSTNQGNTVSQQTEDPLHSTSTEATTTPANTLPLTRSEAILRAGAETKKREAVSTGTAHTQTSEVNTNQPERRRSRDDGEAEGSKSLPSGIFIEPAHVHAEMRHQRDTEKRTAPLQTSVKRQLNDMNAGEVIEIVPGVNKEGEKAELTEEERVRKIVMQEIAKTLGDNQSRQHSSSSTTYPPPPPPRSSSSPSSSSSLDPRDRGNRTRYDNVNMVDHVMSEIYPAYAISQSAEEIEQYQAAEILTEYIADYLLTHMCEELYNVCDDYVKGIVQTEWADTPQ